MKVIAVAQWKLYTQLALPQPKAVWRLLDPYLRHFSQMLISTASNWNCPDKTKCSQTVSKNFNSNSMIYQSMYFEICQLPIFHNDSSQSPFGQNSTNPLIRIHISQKIENFDDYDGSRFNVTRLSTKHYATLHVTSRAHRRLCLHIAAQLRRRIKVTTGNCTSASSSSSSKAQIKGSNQF